MERRGENPGRREDDQRWLQVQQELMNLTTAVRTSQQELANLEIQTTKLEEHVDEVDDYIRGVAGQESVEVRIRLMEKHVQAHGEFLRKFSNQSEAAIKEIKEYLATLKIQTGIAAGAAADKEKSELTKLERFKEWLKFWSPIIALCLGMVVPLITLIFQNWDKIVSVFNRPPMTAESLQKGIDEDKKGEAGKRVQKKLDEIDAERKKIGIR